LLKGILGNSSLSNRAELMATLSQMSQPDPNAQQAALQQQQAAAALTAAQTADLQASAASKAADAQKTQMETQLLPVEQRVKMVTAASTNLDNGGDFEKRLKLADMMLKEKQVNLKEADIQSNERIAQLQMIKK
jgi:hypothetical protein